MKKRTKFPKMILFALSIVCLSALNCQSVKYYVLKIDSPTPQIGNSLKVVTYNIANARGNTDDFFYDPKEEVVKYNLDWIVETLRSENPDVICLNEVDFNSIRTYNIDEADYIAKALGYKYVLKETIFGVPPILQIGNAVISKYPLKINFHRQFGYSFTGHIEHVFKSFVDFDVLLDNSGRKLNFILTHLDANKDDKRRCDEVAILRVYLEKKTQPFVFAGDMNSGPGEQCFDNLFDWGLIGMPEPLLPSYPSNEPKTSIDHILVSKGLGRENYHTITGIEASDHVPVAADIILN